ncbi:MAG: class A beta-lactamase-related serine hydrolase [Chloroflexi bacterium]|nr:class A beta-lactamase-related serine hydrolase [Chloroflexota bacterium]
MDIKNKIEKLLPEDIEFGIAVEHVESGDTFEINGDKVFPTASIFKVPVMVEVFRQAREGKFNLNDRLELQSRYKTLTTGVLLTLQDGLMLSIRDLMMLMTIISDNTATSMLMELVGAENITHTMHELGLPSMSIVITVHEMFLHAFGIPDQKDISLKDLYQRAHEVEMDYTSRTFSRGTDNDVSSAKDMTRLLSMIQKGEIVDPEASQEMIEILRNQQYSSRVPRYLPWRSVANKTGTMRGLRNDSGIITCSPESHAAYSIFSFDPTPLQFGDRHYKDERASSIEKIMGEIGLIIYNEYLVK